VADAQDAAAIELNVAFQTQTGLLVFAGQR
jgi:hypothetical protein